MNIAFIGLGIMGSRMASNLIQAGYPLCVYNRSKEPVHLLVSLGASSAASPAEAVADADVVITMLSTPVVVKKLALGDHGFLGQMKKEALWMDCSTVHPSFSLEAAAEAISKGIGFIDAPVAGTKPHAESAALVFFVGGEAAHLAIAQPLMEAMGRKALHIGGHGKGTSFKMLVNGMLAQSMILFSESLLLGEKMGLNREFLLNTLPNLVVAAPFTKSKAEMIRVNDYDVQFPLEWMHKDLHLLCTTAYEHQQPLFLANVAKELFAAAVEEGFHREDFAAIHKYLERK